MDWFLYDNGLCHERVKVVIICRIYLSCKTVSSVERCLKAGDIHVEVQCQAPSGTKIIE